MTEVSSCSVGLSREAWQACLGRNDLALTDGERKIDPKRGCAPVCPDRHAMLHNGVKNSRSLADLRARLRDAT